MNVYRQPIQFEILDEDEQWSPFLSVRAKVNSYGGKEEMGAGAVQADETLNFEVRYCKDLADLTSQSCRIRFQNRLYDVVHIDDYMFRHQTLKFKGVGKIGREMHRG